MQISKVSSEYSGGAHGISTFEDYVFDLKSKERIRLKDIVVTGKMNALKTNYGNNTNWCQEKIWNPTLVKKTLK